MIEESKGKGKDWKNWQDPKNGRFIPGNPGAGRPKGTVSVVEEIKRKLETVPEGKKKTYLQIFVEKVFKKAIDDEDVPMMRDLIDRVDGKAQQSIKADVEGTILLLDKDDEED